MGIINYFNHIFKREVTADANVSTGGTSNGVTIRPNTVYIGSADEAMKVAPFARAVDLRARTFAQGVFEFQRNKGGVWTKFAKGSADYTHHNYLLHVKANSRQSASEAWEQLLRILDTSRNGMACMYMAGKRSGYINELIPCTCDYVSYTNEYVITNEDFALAMTVRADEVLVLKNRVGGQRSISLMMQCMRLLKLAATAENFALETMAKGGTFKAIVKQEGQSSIMAGMDGYDDDEVRKNLSAMEDRLNMGADLIYDPSAAQLHQISQSFQDLQVPSILQYCLEAIARHAGVPLPLILSSNNAVYKSVDDALHTLVGVTLMPYWLQIVQELNGKLLTESDYDKFRYTVKTDHICIDSDKAKADTLSVKINAGIITANEAREALNLPARTDGNELNKPKETSNNAKEGDEA